MTTEPNDVHSESIATKKLSLAVEEHINQKEKAMLDFSKAGVVVHFTSVFHATNRQVQAEKNSENQTVENQDKGGEKGSLACRHKVISSNPGDTGLTGSLNRSDRSRQRMTVGCRQKEKCNIIHIKVPHLSNVFDKVCFTSNSQLDPIFVVNSFISDSIINNSMRSIEDDLLVSDSMPLDSTSQCIVKIKKVGHKNTLTFKFSTSSLSKFFSSWCAYGYSGLQCKRSRPRAIVKSDANIVINSKVSGLGSAKKGIAEWIGKKSEPFVCLALKPSPQMHRLEKIKYTFDLTLCDNLFDILLENNFIKFFDHKVSPSPLELKDKKYCKWHNSFNHNTSDCNIFRQFIQSAIDTRQLRFAQTREDDQLATIGFNGKGSLNRLAAAGLSKDPDLIAKEVDSNLPSVEKDIVHNLQDQVIFGDDEPIKTRNLLGGKRIFRHGVRNLFLFLFWSHRSDRCNPKVKPVTHRSDRCSPKF
jgi:hypothetical protein